MSDPHCTYSLTVTAAPAVEPVTTAEAKAHLRVDHSTEDSLIAGLVQAARELCEAYTGRRFVTQTVRVSYADFPRGEYAWDSAVRFPVEPVQSVSSVQYYDGDGTLTTLGASAYQTWLDHSPPLIGPAPNGVWPSVQEDRQPAVLVTAVVGYGLAAAVPQMVKAAVLLAVGDWYANRGDGASPHRDGLPAGAKRLLDLLWPGGYR